MINLLKDKDLSQIACIPMMILLLSFGPSMYFSVATGLCVAVMALASMIVTLVLISIGE